MHGASFLGSILVRGAPYFWARFWCAVCGAPIFGPISVHGVPFWDRFWCVARRFWARFWCTVCGAPILGDFVARCTFWVRFWRVAFLGSIGALMLGSITASGQQDLSRLERTWGEPSPRPVEYGALVLAHDALLGGFWCEVRLFGLGFGVRCAVFGLDFGARCAVFGLDFGARCVVRRFSGRFRCTVRLFGLARLERTWGESSPRPVEYGALVLAHDALSDGFWCEVRLFGLGFGVRCAVFEVDFGARCAVFGLDFGARYVVRRF